MRLRVLLPLCLCAISTVGAQERFVTQYLVVPTFAGADRHLASRAADIVRDRVADAFPKSELRVTSRSDISQWLRLSGFDAATQLSEAELRELATKFRSDERITGAVSALDGRVVVRAKLSLIRDLALTQPFIAEGANIDVAANAVAADVIAARRQFGPLRRCENFERSGAHQQAARAAQDGVIAYPPAVPARICLLRALKQLDAKPDTVRSVARATLSIAPGNPVALAYLSDALEQLGDRAGSADAAIRLLATDSTNESLIESVVTTLSRLGFTQRAAPIIDRGSDQHADNLPLLKLRWLVHLANEEWKPAIAAGEKMREVDRAAQADPDFFSRLARAYRADSQPTRALAVAATGVAAFPLDAQLFVVYLQLVRAENDAALTRGLAAMPTSPELHAFAAQQLKASGNVAAAITETRRAAAADPSLPHAYLQLAQLEIDAGHPDSATAALQDALAHGEDAHVVAQFALARGNAAYKAATASQKRDDFQRALSLLALAARVEPTPEARFLVGASSLSIGQAAAAEAPITRSCDLSRLAESSLREAETNLSDGGSAAPEAARQYLDYVARLRPYVENQLKAFCNAASRSQRVPGHGL